MKICFVSNYFPGYHTVSGGAERACYLLAKLLIKDGHELSLITTLPNKTPTERFDIHYTSILIDLWRRKFSISWLEFDPFVYVNSYRILKQMRPDVLHMHNINRLSYSVVLSAKRLGIPVVHSIYDYWAICPGKILMNKELELCRKYHGAHCKSCVRGYGGLALSLRKKFFDYIFNKVDKFIVLSKFAGEILREYGIAQDKIAAVALPLFEEAGPREGRIEKNTILFVGWNRPHKGFGILLEAMDKVVKTVPDAKLYAIFTDSTEGVDEAVRKHKLDRHVVVIGKTPHDAIKDYLRISNVVVIPEQWENVGPLFLGEAMSFAKPIVASSIGGIPEFIEDGKSGFLVDSKDAAGFAGKIIWMLENRQEALRMGDAARANARRIFDEKEILRRLLNIYRKGI